MSCQPFGLRPKRLLTLSRRLLIFAISASRRFALSTVLTRNAHAFHRVIGPKVTVFDYVVITIIAVSILLSALRGFVKEVLGLVAWVAAFVAAMTLSAPFSNLMVTSITDDRLRIIAAFVGVFFGTLLLMSLVAWGFSNLLKSAGLGLEDRILGGVFGLARGLILVMVLVLLAGLTSLPKQPAWTNAVLSPPLEALAKTMSGWLPQTLSRYISYD